MKVYIVNVTAYIPYPISREYTERATEFGAAISRAIRKYRSDERIKGHHIDTMLIRVGKATIK